MSLRAEDVMAAARRGDPADCGCEHHVDDHGSCAGCSEDGCRLPSIHTPSLRDRIDRLLAALEKNERDRELSPYWKWGDGRMMNRAEWEGIRASEVRMGQPAPGLDFYGEPVK